MASHGSDPHDQDPIPCEPQPERVPLRQAAIQADISMKSARRYLKRGLVQFEQRGATNAYFVDPEELRQVSEEVRSRLHAERRERPRPRGRGARPAVDNEAGGDDCETSESPDSNDAAEHDEAVAEKSANDSDAVKPESDQGRNVGPSDRADRRGHESRHVLAPASPDSGLLVSAMPPEVNLPPLNARVRLVSVLSRTASLCVRRIPVDKGDAGLWALAKVPLFESFSRTELLKAASQGGLDVLLSKNLGSGKYELLWISPYSTVLHREVRVIPDMVLEAGRFQAQAEQQERAARKAQAAAKQKHAQRKIEQQFLVELAVLERQRDGWIGAVLRVVHGELLRRIRWLTSLHMALLAEGERRQERWAADCTLLAARIRREGPGPYDLDLDRLYPPKPPAITPEETPIMAALTRMAAVDVDQVLRRAGEILVKIYEERGQAHPFDPGLIWAVEPVLPYVPTTGLESVQFVPWLVAELWPALGAA